MRAKCHVSYMRAGRVTFIHRAAIVQLKVLAPGETFDLFHEWDQRTNRGEAVEPELYTAQGIVLTDGSEALTSARKPLLIIPLEPGPWFPLWGLTRLYPRCKWCMPGHKLREEK